MKLATTTGGFFPYTKSQTEALKSLAQAGFRYADYSFIADYRERTGIYGQESEKHIAQVAETADLLGVRLVQAHAPMGAPLADADGQLLRDTVASVEACGKWGIDNLVVHAGYAYGLSREETFQRNKEFFLPILHAAEKSGVNILVENFNKMTASNRYWTDNAPDLLVQIQCVDHPLFHAIWDIGHANLQPMPQAEALRLLGGHVRALHIHDNAGDRDTHMPPFTGTVDMDSVMQGLVDIGYQGYFTYEVGQIVRPGGKDTLLGDTPLQLRVAAERYWYEMGKFVLEAYNCFEE